MTQPLCKCNICGEIFESKEAAIHVVKTGHNNWSLVDRYWEKSTPTHKGETG